MSKFGIFYPKYFDTSTAQVAGAEQHNVLAVLDDAQPGQFGDVATLDALGEVDFAPAPLSRNGRAQRGASEGKRTLVVRSSCSAPDVTVSRRLALAVRCTAKYPLNFLFVLRRRCRDRVAVLQPAHGPRSRYIPLSIATTTIDVHVSGALEPPCVVFDCPPRSASAHFSL